MQLHVVGPLADGARPPPSQALDSDLVVQEEGEGGHQRLTPAIQLGLQGLRLWQGAREPVQDEPAIRVFDGLHHHLDHHVVGHQLSRPQVLLGLDAQTGPFLDVAPEDVPGGDEGDAKPVGQPVGLGPLAGPGRSEEHQPH